MIRGMFSAYYKSNGQNTVLKFNKLVATWSIIPHNFLLHGWSSIFSKFSWSFSKTETYSLHTANAVTTKVMPEYVTFGYVELAISRNIFFVLLWLLVIVRVSLDWKCQYYQGDSPWKGDDQHDFTRWLLQGDRHRRGNSCYEISFWLWDSL